MHHTPCTSLLSSFGLTVFPFPMASPIRENTPQSLHGDTARQCSIMPVPTYITIHCTYSAGVQTRPLYQHSSHLFQIPPAQCTLWCPLAVSECDMYHADIAYLTVPISGDTVHTIDARLHHIHYPLYLFCH